MSNPLNIKERFRNVKLTNHLNILYKWFNDNKLKVDLIHKMNEEFKRNKYLGDNKIKEDEEKRVNRFESEEEKR